MHGGPGNPLYLLFSRCFLYAGQQQHQFYFNFEHQQHLLCTLQTVVKSLFSGCDLCFLQSVRRSAMALNKRGSLCLILLLQVLQLNLAIVLWNTLQSSSSQSRDMECDHWSDTLRVRDQVDDDFWILILLLSSAEEHSGREFYYRARSHTWYNVWVRDMPDQHIWKCMFGMTPASAEKLCRMLAPYLTRKASNLRSPTPVDHKVMLTIHFMRTGDKMECMSQFFGLGKSTVHKYVHDVCKAIVKVMLRKYVRLPSSRGECRKLMAGFYKFSRFPNVIGCVDGVHFLVQKPNGIRGHEYTDRKRHTSVMCQAMCDHNCRFMDIISCWAGSVNDSRVMSLCSLRRKGMAGNLGHGLQCIVLGDAGYSIMPWLITPFTQRGRTGIELPRRPR